MNKKIDYSIKIMTILDVKNLLNIVNDTFKRIFVNGGFKMIVGSSALLHSVWELLGNDHHMLPDNSLHYHSRYISIGARVRFRENCTFP